MSLDFVLNCPCCKQIYDDPRILECGETICKKCSISLIERNDSKAIINCPSCQEQHQVPKSGLIPNIELEKLVKLQTARVLGSLVDNFKFKLYNIESKSKSFSNDLKMGKVEIKDFCNMIRGDIMSTSEAILKHVEEQKINLIRKVNEYESECVKQLEQIKKENRNQYENVLERSNQFSTKWVQYVEQKNLNQAELVDACKKADELIEQLENETFGLQKSTFNGRIIKFEQNMSQIDENIIGSVYFEDITGKDEDNEDQYISNALSVCVENNGTNTPQYSPKKPQINSDGKISSRLIILNSRKLRCNEDDEDDDDL